MSSVYSSNQLQCSLTREEVACQVKRVSVGGEVKHDRCGRHEGDDEGKRPPGRAGGKLLPADPTEGTCGTSRAVKQCTLVSNYDTFMMCY